MSQPPKKPENPHTLPESLRKQLKQFRSHVWWIKVVEAILASFFGLLISYLIVFALDRFIPTHALIRLLFFLAGVSLLTVFTPIWLNRWVFKHRRENQLASLIAKQYPRLGDRLLGVVELQNQDEQNTSLSPRLRDAAMAEVANEIQNRDLHDALPKSWHKKWSFAVIALTSLAVTVLVLHPKAALNAMHRWVMPLADIERYTETKIDLNALPQPYYVAHGEAYTLTVPLTEDSNIPQSAKAREGVKPWSWSTPQNQSYHFNFPKIFKQQEIEIRVGDAYGNIEVTPIMRPTLEKITARVSYPDYLQKKDKQINISSGQASIVQGSITTLTARANRPLDSATLTTEPNHASIPASSQSKTSSDKIDLPATVDGNTFTLPPVHINQASVNLALNWTDQYKLKNQTPTKLSIQQHLDALPSAYIQNIVGKLYLLANSTIEFKILAEDDFGIKQAGIEWSGEYTKPSPHSPAKGSLTVITGSPDLRNNASEPIIFSFQAYDIRPQKLTLRAWTEDYHPEHQRSYSEPITVYVLTKDEHRELLEKRSQKAINQLENLLRNELDALDENLRLNKKSGKELQENQSREDLAEQAEREKENAKKMKELAEMMEDIFKEASKNGEIESNTMKKLAESALNMKNMAEQDMPDIAESLNQAQSAENTEQRTKEQLKQAIEKQSELLKKMKETIEKTNQANKELEAGTFINRLRKAASDQEEIANTMAEAVRNPRSRSLYVLSKEFEDLDPEDQRTMVGLYALQEQISYDVRWIQEDLGHFFSRTQQQKHKDLFDKMQTSGIDSAMAALLRNIEQNHNNISINQAKRNASTLLEWARELQNAAPQNDAGGGGGGNSDTEEDDVEFMIRVMELIQKEQNIRAKNRSLEQKRRLLAPTEPSSQTPKKRLQ